MWTSSSSSAICVGLIVWFRVCGALTVYDLYNTQDESDVRLLPNGDRQYELVQLKQPIHFYSETYDHIYVRANRFSDLKFSLYG